MIVTNGNANNGDALNTLSHTDVDAVGFAYGSGNHVVEDVLLP